MGQLKQWLKQDWVRIGTDGSIKGPCGTSKDKKTLIVACLDLKLIVYPRVNALRQHVKRKRQALKERLQSLIQRLRK